MKRILPRLLALSGALLAGGSPAGAHSWHDDQPPSPEVLAARAELLAQLALERARTPFRAAAAVVAPYAPEPATAGAPPPGYGAAMAASFGAFRPKVRTYWDQTTFHVESDSMPDPVRQPNLMVGITSWQQQVPLPVSYFASLTSPERDQGSLAFGKPNVWRLPLVPTPAANPIPISGGNFQRGAIAIGADGVPIFNPRNNGGRVSYEIGELDLYGGHCGLADDYHYHLAPVHLQAVLGVGLPVAWALDGYPIYGYTEPDGSPRLALDADGGHDHGPWKYHYHAIGTDAAGPQPPYLPAAFHGTVVQFGGQVDGQPTTQAIRQNNTGGYVAQAIPGARITAYRNPASLATDDAGNLVESAGAPASPDAYLMRYVVGTTTYDICWRLNRAANPKTLTITWRRPGISPTTTTYQNGNNRITSYVMGGPSLRALPDTGQTLDATPVFGEDSDYTLNPPAYRDHGDGTVTDLVTGLMWQKIDAGESTWEAAVARAATLDTGGYSDWRLPTPMELFSLMTFGQGNPAMNTTFFPPHPAGAAEYWWSSDIYGTDAARVWSVNAGGGLGPKPKAETISAGGRLRYHARYVRGARPGNGHHYVNNLDGTVTDLDTGLMWTQVPAPAMTWSSALAYAEDLALAGHGDWRLPNVRELQSLTDYTLATAASRNGAQAAINRLVFPSATTPATAYWSSTALRSGNAAPTSAWLVEFGYNNTVPAANGPNRAAQGIISYELMTSSYPVFAVRSAPQARPPVLTEEPRAFQTVAPGASVQLTVGATGEGTLTYQWRKAGVAIPGATRSTLALANVGAADAGTYSVLVSGSGGTVESGPAGVALGTARMANLSVRSGAGAGDATLIVGFVLAGGSPPTLLARGVGPTLGAFGVGGSLADPVLTLFSGAGVALATNDDWGGGADATALASAAAEFGAFALPAGSRDAALLTAPAAGAYTAQLTGKAGASGVALVELYHRSGAGVAGLVNLSARTRVGTGAEVLIAGFVIAGSEPKRLLIRAVGPALAGFGVGDVLADPQLALYRQGSAAALRLNDDWGAGGAVALAAAAGQVGAFALPANSRDSALLVVLEPGAYTAQISGAGAASGVALLELYDVP
ncbi:MAG: DUF1566 domain-containing protein [Opitutaceae bacterium]